MSVDVAVPRHMVIDGELVLAEGQRSFESVDPSSERVIAEVPRASLADVDRAVRSAHDAMSGAWSTLMPDARAVLLHRVADLIEENRERIAQLETLDMGKPLRESRTNVDRSVKTFRYYAGACDKLQGDSIPVGPNSLNFTIREPLGVTAHITPWNYPFANACRSIPAALAAGNTVVLKPASYTPLTTMLLGEIGLKAGLPPGVVNVVTGGGAEAGAALAAHPLVRGITFTGAVDTGKQIMRMAAEHVRPCVLELGGKNPQVVFADADVDHALGQTVRGAFNNSGQVCTSVSRVLVERSLKDSYVEALREKLDALTIGDPRGDVDLGPLVAEAHRAQVESFLLVATTGGARVVRGGKRPDELEHGWYYEPTLLDSVDPSNRIAREEVFGPILSIIPFDGEQEALRIANGLELGLTAGVFTKDLDRAMRMVRRLEAGMVWVNDWFASPVQVPHGGYKESGMGREQGLEGLLSYTQTKDVSIRIAT